MNCLLKLSIHSLFGICLFFPLRMAGQAGLNSYLQYPGALLSWPTQPRPPMAAEGKILSDGENSYPSIVLRGAELELVAAQEDGLMVGGHNDRYSIFFRHRVLPHLIVGISIFRPGSFLRELSNDSLMAYAKGLLVRKPSDVTVNILEGPLDEMPRATFPLIAGFPRKLAYDWTQESPNGTKETIRRVEYFTQVKGQLVVVTYENHPDGFDRSRPFVEEWLIRLTENSQ